jgi:hypothetical protein
MRSYALVRIDAKPGTRLELVTPSLPFAVAGRRRLGRNVEISRCFVGLPTRNEAVGCLPDMSQCAGIDLTYCHLRNASGRAGIPMQSRPPLRDPSAARTLPAKPSTPPGWLTRAARPSRPSHATIRQRTLGRAPGTPRRRAPKPVGSSSSSTPVWRGTSIRGWRQAEFLDRHSTSARDEPVDLLGDRGGLITGCRIKVLVDRSIGTTSPDLPFSPVSVRRRAVAAGGPTGSAACRVPTGDCRSAQAKRHPGRATPSKARTARASSTS